MLKREKENGQKRSNKTINVMNINDLLKIKKKGKNEISVKT
jgi:hypothetical protein